MKKIPVRKILNGLGKLNEYYYPVGKRTMFILPDGRMVGVNKPFMHMEIFKDILKRELTAQEFMDMLVEIKSIRLVLYDGRMHVNIVTPCNSEQKSTLEGLVMCGKYEFICDDERRFVPGAPSYNYCRRLLGLPIIRT